VASSRARSSDIKLLASATVAVLLVGFFIAGAALIATRSGSKNPVCGQLNIGNASDVRDNLDQQGPNFITAGSSCGFWIALDNGDIVAYKVRQPSGCTVKLRDRGTRWVCDGATIDPSRLAQYPVSIQRFGTTDAVIVDLGPPPTTSTAAT
jgi:hypothetical protein